MSSMRNAVQRRNHKERAQPLERQKWGLLEKHKDYSLRAKDHNEKKRRLRTLRQKAAERNPDEFAFGMMSSTTKKGVKVTQRGVENGTSGSLSVDIVKLLKTQDAGYLQTVLQQTKRERERTMEQATILRQGVNINPAEADLGRRKRFDEDGNEIAELALVMDEDEDDDDDLDDLNGLDGIGGVDDGKALTKDERKAKKKHQRMIEVLDNRLEALAEREEKLTQALDGLQNQRAKMQGTIGGVNKNGVKFKIRERKR
ncbi:U3 small nucleolar RNA-associated protein 11 [Myriangium duriaei CBS 260.36]|uniref:U3 small nucleolar RNA-associated protein 11 n=1 Tax=Myriangium duriaei CBS 260.36 TaxID=1168546 RepID=A0A9P4MKG4_9PEZI|nr:U3 small nucleolar RNA-associated protein 11 [Myriangium duriaei CBS 260.36]